jgi:RNAse (barnase) inhibitor barstar
VQILFSYGDEHLSGHAVALANIAKNITSKGALLTTLATQLSFPDYFGGNWDALEECIGDLSWLPIGPVIVKHVDVPLIGDVRSAKAYVAILSAAARKMSKSDDHPLSIVFPTECRDQVSWLLRSASATR